MAHRKRVVISGIGSSMEKDMVSVREDTGSNRVVRRVGEGMRGISIKLRISSDFLWKKSHCSNSKG